MGAALSEVNTVSYRNPHQDGILGLDYEISYFEIYLKNPGMGGRPAYAGYSNSRDRRCDHLPHHNDLLLPVSHFSPQRS